MTLRLDLTAIFLSQSRRRKRQFRGLHWNVLWSFILITLTPTFNAENNKTPTSPLDDERFTERESRRLYVRPLNYNNNQHQSIHKHLLPLNNRLSHQESPKQIINNHFITTPTSFHHQHSHPSSPLQNRIHAYVIRKSPPPPPGLINQHQPPPQDLQPAAQTLYDLRGFHIPLGGQEETQRFLRQQNELDQHHRTKPLVFPSFFQPQTPNNYVDTRPQAINIFGHNQHHQQTNRYTLPGKDDSTFRPSQPDFGLTTSTENVFKPIVAPTQSEHRSLENNNNNNNVNVNSVKNEFGKTRPELIDDPFVYVYDDPEYDEIEQEVEAELDKKKASVNSPTEGDSPSHVRANQPTAVLEISTTTNVPRTRQEAPLLNHNHFVVDSQSVGTFNDNSNSNFFIRQEAPPFHADNPFYERPQTLPESIRPNQRPRVEIVPSSERKPPPDQSNSINHNLPRQRPTPIIYEDIQPSFEPQRHLDYPGPLSNNNDFKPSVRFVPPVPSQLPTQIPSSFVTNEIPQFQRNQNLKKERPFVIGHDFSNQFVQDPIPIEQAGPSPTSETFHQPEQPLRPVNTIFPQLYLDNETPTSNDYIINEQGVPELGEVLRESTPKPSTRATTQRTSTTISTTTAKPFRRNPFPTRHRLVPTARTSPASSTSSTTAIVPSIRRPIRPRFRTTTTTTPPDVLENFVSNTEELPIQKLGVKKAYEAEAPGFGVTAVDVEVSPVQTSSREKIATLGRQRLVATLSPKQQRHFTDEVQVIPSVNVQENLLTESPLYQGQNELQYIVRTTPVQEIPRIPEKFGIVQRQSFPERATQSYLRRPPPPTSPQSTTTEKGTGKPLYLNAKDKEGGLYADYIIPFGHLYGSPIPFLPINQIMERMPGLFDGHSVSQNLPRAPPSPSSTKPIIIKKKPATPRIRSNISPIAISRQTASTTTVRTTTTSAPIRKTVILSSNESETKTDVDNLITQSPPHGNRIKPLRRRVKPRPIQPTPSPTPELVTLRPVIPIPTTGRIVPTPALEVSPPATSKPNPTLKRRPRPRFRISTTAPTLSSESAGTAESDEDESDIPIPNPRPRKLIKKLRPTRRSFRRNQVRITPTAEYSEESVTQVPIRVLRKQTETPERFSSRFRDEAALRPTPTVPVQTEVAELSLESPAPPQRILKKRPLKKVKVSSISDVASDESVEAEAKVKSNAIATDLQQDDGLPASILLQPKDVVLNRKPARRIPPGSASDKLKALQEKRRKLLSNRVNPRKGVAVKHSTTPPTTKASVPESDEEDDDEEGDEYSDDDEQVQKKREITVAQEGGRNEMSNNSLRSSKSLRRTNDTDSNSEESLLGIPKPTAQSHAPTPSLPIVQWFTDKTQQQRTVKPDTTVEELTEAESQVENTSIASSDKTIANIFQTHPVYGKSATSAPMLSMSTNEPSLPLEAYFPIVSSQRSNNSNSNNYSANIKQLLLSSKN